MSLATVTTVLTKFLQQENARVIAIKGSWGVGKTHMWKELLKQHKDVTVPAKYSYVSLFGISSIAQLRTAIFAKAVSTKDIEQALTFDNINENWARLSLNGLKRLANFSGRAFAGSDSGKTISIGLETVAQFLINDTLICLDDFERLPESVSYDELLGYISELREEKNCKVVLIFNHDQLSDPTTYEKYREKVIDIELEYEPTAPEAVQLVLPDTLQGRDEIKKYCEILNINNIRVLKKILTLVNELYPYLKDLHPRVYLQAIHTGVLFSWSYFSNEENVPPISFLQTWNRLTHQMNARDAQDANTDPRWINTLNLYGIFNIDEFDEKILDVIKKGFVEEEPFLDVAKKRSDLCFAEDLDQSFSNAWQLYHNTFRENEDEVATALFDSVKNSLSQVSPMNLSGTSMLLRYLERDKEADELIELYVEAWVKANNELDIKRYPFADDIKDPLIWKLFAEKEKSLDVAVPLTDLAAAIISDTITSKQLKFLKLASVDDFFTMFKQEHGAKLPSLIANCLRYSEYSPDLRIIGENARAALVRIGKENRLNARRVVRYNISIENQ